MMNSINQLLFNKKQKCPRCLGKGHVDFDDIKRLGKKLKWLPGSCAYCDGTGKVTSKVINTIAVDNTYLTSDLSEVEKRELLSNKDLARAKGAFIDNKMERFFNQIKFLHQQANLSAEKITEFYLIGEQNISSPEDQKDLLNSITKVIKSLSPTSD